MKELTSTQKQIWENIRNWSMEEYGIEEKEEDIPSNLLLPILYTTYDKENDDGDIIECEFGEIQIHLDLANYAFVYEFRENDGKMYSYTEQEDAKQVLEESADLNFDGIFSLGMNYREDAKEVEYTIEWGGNHYVGEIVMHHGHECKVTNRWYVDGKHGITIIPTGGYGFEVDIYDEQL